MAFYLVHARPRPEILEELQEKLAADAFVDLKPFGRALSKSLRNARRVGELAVWEEEDYCTPPLKEERAAVLDTYFNRPAGAGGQRRGGVAQHRFTGTAVPGRKLVKAVRVPKSAKCQDSMKISYDFIK
jgi:hypothetical protein